jgi:hypothetical protein
LSGQQHAQILLNLFRLVWTAARARLPSKRAQGCRANARKAAGQAHAICYFNIMTNFDQFRQAVYIMLQFAISIFRPISTNFDRITQHCHAIQTRAFFEKFIEFIEILKYANQNLQSANQDLQNANQDLQNANLD